MKFLVGLPILVLAVASYSQTYPGCGEKDYRCQLDAATKALQADPSNPENYYNIGLIFQKAGAHKEAVESFSMYVAIPGLTKEFLADGYNNRGVSNRRLGKADLAFADYSRAFELVPTNPRFVANRGNANTDLKKFDAALADYAAALKLDPKFAPAYSGRASLYGLMGRHDDAIADFARAIEYEPSEPENYYNRAVIYRETREHAKSIADLDKYIALKSGNTAYMADGYINRGIAYAMLGQPEKALADFSRVIELDPKRVNAYRARAMVYRELKRGELAAADEKKAAELMKQ